MPILCVQDSVIIMTVCMCLCESAGYIQEYTRLATDLATNKESDVGPQPVNLYDIQLELMPKNRFDRAPQGSRFGAVINGTDVKPSYYAGDTVSVTFQAANPRNNQRVQGTFLTVEKQRTLEHVSKTVFEVVHNDGDWSTKFRWHAGPEDPLDFGVAATSVIEMTWAIPSDAAAGVYRICYFGDHKIAKNAAIVPFTGCSSTFTVSA
jgi:neutral ceramidase